MAAIGAEASGASEEAGSEGAGAVGAEDDFSEIFGSDESAEAHPSDRGHRLSDSWEQVEGNSPKSTGSTTATEDWCLAAASGDARELGIAAGTTEADPVGVHRPKPGSVAPRLRGGTEEDIQRFFDALETGRDGKTSSPAPSSGSKVEDDFGIFDDEGGDTAAGGAGGGGTVGASSSPRRLDCPAGAQGTLVVQESEGKPSHGDAEVLDLGAGAGRKEAPRWEERELPPSRAGDTLPNPGEEAMEGRDLLGGPSEVAEVDEAPLLDPVPANLEGRFDEAAVPGELESVQSDGMDSFLASMAEFMAAGVVVPTPGLEQGTGTVASPGRPGPLSERGRTGSSDSFLQEVEHLLSDVGVGGAAADVPHPGSGAELQAGDRVRVTRGFYEGARGTVVAVAGPAAGKTITVVFAEPRPHGIPRDSLPSDDLALDTDRCCNTAQASGSPTTQSPREARDSEAPSVLSRASSIDVDDLNRLLESLNPSTTSQGGPLTAASGPPPTPPPTPPVHHSTGGTASREHNPQDANAPPKSSTLLHKKIQDLEALVAQHQEALSRSERETTQRERALAEREAKLAAAQADFEERRKSGTPRDQPRDASSPCGAPRVTTMGICLGVAAAPVAAATVPTTEALTAQMESLTAESHVLERADSDQARCELEQCLRQIEMLKLQLKNAGVKPIDEVVSLEEAKQRLKRAVEQMIGGNEDAQVDFDKWDEYIRCHPEHKEEQQRLAREWEEKNREKNEQALRALRTFVPPDIYYATLDGLKLRGVQTPLAKRLWDRKILWWCRSEPSIIAKTHAADLKVKFAFQGLDLRELRAVSAMLPQTFDNDSTGDKKKWRENFMTKLKEMVQQEEQNRLPAAQQIHRTYADHPELFDPDAESVLVQTVKGGAFDKVVAPPVSSRGRFPSRGIRGALGGAANSLLDAGFAAAEGKLHGSVRTVRKAVAAKTGVHNFFSKGGAKHSGGDTEGGLTAVEEQTPHDGTAAQARPESTTPGSALLDAIRGGKKRPSQSNAPSTPPRRASLPSTAASPPSSLMEAIRKRQAAADGAQSAAPEGGAPDERTEGGSSSASSTTTLPPGLGGEPSPQSRLLAAIKLKKQGQQRRASVQ
uniref:KOW domain-containing protein n=1 Tax=Rhizochromulina marina TaxID=1034831 RepID=A0A7S2RMF6_9STRA|mmetsp:Transcript_18317/g.53537  ORF Transcript_18317/g.53537 Transcript_18317/m.53537 type:complete len:1105 (+) Transcript_18317:224-3538(+)